MRLDFPRGRRVSSEQQRSKVGFPIRRFTDQSLFAAPHDLSQRTTSFIASQRQGIHQTPLRHLIALIAKARLLTLPIGSERLGAKRPVLLQTHPGIQSGQLHESTTGCPKATWMERGPPRRFSRTQKDEPRSSGLRPNALPLHNVRHHGRATSRDGPRPGALGGRTLLQKRSAIKTLHRTVGDAVS